ITLYLKKGIKYYNKELKELVEKKTDTSGNKILLEKDLVKLPKSMHHLRDDVEALFKDDGMDVLDIVAIEKSRGGSVDAERMMVLVKDGSDRRLFDLKERQDTAVSAYEKQSDVAEWLSQLYPVFWPDKSPSTYTLVKLNGKDFWVREKKKSLIDVPYDAKKSAEVAYLKALAPYVSNLLGRIHGSQASAKGLKTLLKSPEGTAAFQQAVKTTYRTYIDEARKALSLPTSNDGKKKSGQISCRAAAGG
ncbi:MAG TPA: hypothetical protein VM432_03860, partial [Bdellovibrionales bacterium]|nr:hypothetical protein [Bdellovibrionales bacterium]